MSSAENEREQRPRRARLVRTRQGRIIGGVCSGLGAHFDVDPILVRIVFVGLALFSGLGIALYLAILLLVPEEGAGRAPIWLSRSSWLTVLGVLVVVAAGGIAIQAVGHTGHRGAGRFAVGAGVLVLVGVIAELIRLRLRLPAEAQEHASVDRRLFGRLASLTAIAVWSVLLAGAGAWLAGIDGRLAAWVVVAIGATLVASAFIRSARRLVLPALAFAASVAVVAAAHVDLHGGVGEFTYRPYALSDVRHDYRLGAGRLEVDLRNVDFPPGETYLHVRLGVGEVVVLVPRGVCVATSAQIGGGYVGALEQRSGGLDVDWSEHRSPARLAPQLVLSGQLGLGALLVADHPIERGWYGGHGWFGAHSHPGELGANDACDSPLGTSR
jgi:phage shock protein PspC (stress-responsive transcriptional regulator)